jgi:hypothetical protein
MLVSRYATQPKAHSPMLRALALVFWLSFEGVPCCQNNRNFLEPPCVWCQDSFRSLHLAWQRVLREVLRKRSAELDLISLSPVQDGKTTSRGKVKGCLGMPPGAELEFGSWEIQVEAVLEEAQFRCYIAA